MIDADARKVIDMQTELLAATIKELKKLEGRVERLEAKK